MSGFKESCPIPDRDLPLRLRSGQAIRTDGLRVISVLAHPVLSVVGVKESPGDREILHGCFGAAALADGGGRMVESRSARGDFEKDVRGTGEGFIFAVDQSQLAVQANAFELEDFECTGFCIFLDVAARQESDAEAGGNQALEKLA